MIAACEDHQKIAGSIGRWSKSTEQGSLSCKNPVSLSNWVSFLYYILANFTKPAKSAVVFRTLSFFERCRFSNVITASLFASTHWLPGL